MYSDRAYVLFNLVTMSAGLTVSANFSLGSVATVSTCYILRRFLLSASSITTAGLPSRNDRVTPAILSRHPLTRAKSIVTRRR